MKNDTNMHTNNFVEPSLLAELKRKRDYIHYDLSHDGKISAHLLAAVHQDASYHSKIMEPDHAKRSKRIGRRRDFRQTREELREAQVHASNSFNGIISEPFLLSIAELIEPHTLGAYRRDMVRISDYAIDIPPRPEKIPEQMGALVVAANNTQLDPVERAILFHFHFLRIHPLIDGNGRTSRFVQNLMLAHHNYAPAVLPVGERSFYNSLIHGARAGFKERESDGLRAHLNLLEFPRHTIAQKRHSIGILLLKLMWAWTNLLTILIVFPLTE